MIRLIINNCILVKYRTFNVKFKYTIDLKILRQIMIVYFQQFAGTSKTIFICQILKCNDYFC